MTNPITVLIPVVISHDCAWDHLLGGITWILFGVGMVSLAGGILYGSGLLVGGIVSAGYRKGRLAKAWVRRS